MGSKTDYEKALEKLKSLALKTGVTVEENDGELILIKGRIKNIIKKVKSHYSSDYFEVAVFCTSDICGLTQMDRDTVYFGIQYRPDREIRIIEDGDKHTQNLMKNLEDFYQEMVKIGLQVSGTTPNFIFKNDFVKVQIETKRGYRHYKVFRRNEHWKWVVAFSEEDIRNPSRAREIIKNIKAPQKIDKSKLEPHNTNEHMFKKPRYCRKDHVALQYNFEILDATVIRPVTIDEKCKIDSSVEKPGEDPWFLIECRRWGGGNDFKVIYRKPNEYFMVTGNTHLVISTDPERNVLLTEFDRILLDKITTLYAQKVLGFPIDLSGVELGENEQI
jgi:hypothetical protein